MNEASLLIEKLENLKGSLNQDGLKIVEDIINSMYLFRNDVAESDFRLGQKMRADGLISRACKKAEKLLNNHEHLLKKNQG